MTRRVSLAVLFALVLALVVPVVVPITGDTARASHDVGPTRVYFPQTGHHLSNAFLDYWRHNGGLYQFGYPLTEEIDEDGLTVQYFERAVFEWHPNASAGWRVQLRRLGADLHGQRTESAFQPVSAESNASTRYFPETGHRLSFGFKSYWERHGALRIIGYPISEEFTENDFTVQYFERARFEWHPEYRGTQYEILLGQLGRQAAQLNGVTTSPATRGQDVTEYSPGLWAVPAPPKPWTPADVTTPPPGAPKHLTKWIEVDLTHQYLRAWQGDSLVYGTYVSTGTARTPTPPGTYQIFTKLRYETMSGGTRGVDYYYLENVPHTMYFRSGGYALHGAYWHTNFGTRMSHGCVNLPLGAAEWLYNWSPMGTTVWVHH